MPVDLSRYAPDGTKRPARRLFVIGDSSGGGLAAATLLALHEQQQQQQPHMTTSTSSEEEEPRQLDTPLLPVAGLCSISGWFDMSCRASTYRTRRWRDRTKRGDPVFKSGDARHERKGTLEMVFSYLGSVETAATEQPTASPIFASRATLGAAMPPTLVLVGDEEVVLEDSTRWAEALDNAGVSVALEVFPRMWHDWVMYSEGCGDREPGEGEEESAEALPLSGKARPLKEAEVALAHVAAFFRSQPVPTLAQVSIPEGLTPAS